MYQRQPTIYIGYDDSSKDFCEFKEIINNADSDIDEAISSEEKLAIGLFKRLPVWLPPLNDLLA